MFETATSAIAQYIPVATVSLPLVGAIDIQKAAVAAILFIGLTAIFWFVRMIVLVRLEVLAKRSSAQFDDTFVDAIKRIRPWVYTLVALYAALALYTLPETLDRVVTAVLLLAFVWQAIQIAQCFIQYAVTNYLEKDEDNDGVVDPASATMSNMVTLIAGAVGIWDYFCAVKHWCRGHVTDRRPGNRWYCGRVCTTGCLV